MCIITRSIIKFQIMALTIISAAERLVITIIIRVIIITHTFCDRTDIGCLSKVLSFVSFSCLHFVSQKIPFFYGWDKIGVVLGAGAFEIPAEIALNGGVAGDGERQLDVGAHHVVVLVGPVHEMVVAVGRSFNGHLGAVRHGISTVVVVGHIVGQRSGYCRRAVATRGHRQRIEPR